MDLNLDAPRISSMAMLFGHFCEAVNSEKTGQPSLRRICQVRLDLTFFRTSSRHLEELKNIFWSWSTSNSWINEVHSLGMDTFFKKGLHRPLSLFIFGLFKQNYNILQQMNVKNMSIQYIAPGFKPTTSRDESSPITTRPGLPPSEWTLNCEWRPRGPDWLFTVLAFKTWWSVRLQF